MFDASREALLEELESLKREGVYPNIDRSTAEYLYQFILQEQPSTLLEVGACNGYSTIWLGLAALTYGGKLTTIEASRERFEELVRNLHRAGLDEVVTPVHADAKEVLATLPSGIDFVFLDAMKREYITYFTMLEPLLSSGALLVADNINSHREKLKDFVEYVTMHDAFDAEILPLGTGLLVARKH